MMPRAELSKGRWFAAALTGVGVYAAVSLFTAPMLKGTRLVLDMLCMAQPSD